MPLRVACQCGQSLTVPEQKAGLRVLCPLCNTYLTIPAVCTPAAVSESVSTAASVPVKAKAAPSSEQNRKIPLVVASKKHGKSGKRKAKSVAETAAPPPAPPKEKPLPPPPAVAPVVALPRPEPRVPKPRVAAQPPPRKPKPAATVSAPEKGGTPGSPPPRPVLAQPTPAPPPLPKTTAAPPQPPAAAPAEKPPTTDPPPIAAAPPAPIAAVAPPAKAMVEKIDKVVNVIQPTPASASATKSEPPAAPQPAAAGEAEPVRGMEHDPGKTWTVYQLGAALAALALVATYPAVSEIVRHVQDPLSPGLENWTYLVLLVSGIQLIYALYLVQLPDWSTTWVTMIVSAIIAVLYAAGLGMSLMARPDNEVIGLLGLTQLHAGGYLSLWCFMLTMLTALLSYAMVRTSVKWQKAFQFAMAHAEE